MNQILTSASKIVFILLMATACIAFVIGIIKGTTQMESKDFMVLASGAAAFYFSYKGSGSSEEDKPYAGK